MKTTDRFGVEVIKGTRVRILTVDAILKLPLEDEEKERIQSMLGEVLNVYEVDEQGFAWVEKWWHEGNEKSRSHSIALASEEMEVVTE